MVMAVTISWELRKIVSARSTVTEVSIAAPVWSTPLTRSVRRGSMRIGADQIIVFGCGNFGRSHGASCG